MARVRNSCGVFEETHGASETLEYGIWGNMLYRCNNPNAKGYRNYGGRGIRVCQEWHSFENFIRDMGARPSTLHSIERVNNEGDYCPENCRWALAKEQALNRSTNIIFEYRGDVLPLKALAEKHKKNYNMISKRIRRGWDIESALETPAKQPWGKLCSL